MICVRFVVQLALAGERRKVKEFSMKEFPQVTKMKLSFCSLAGLTRPAKEVRLLYIGLLLSSRRLLLLFHLSPHTKMAQFVDPRETLE